MAIDLKKIAEKFQPTAQEDEIQKKVDAITEEWLKNKNKIDDEFIEKYGVPTGRNEWTHDMNQEYAKAQEENNRSRKTALGNI